MGCLWWVKHLIDILSQILQLFMQYLTILYPVITAHDCSYPDMLPVTNRSDMTALHTQTPDLLSPGGCGSYFTITLYKLILHKSSLGTCCEIALRWIPHNTVDGKSTLVQVMTLCHHAPSHSLSQCWSRPMLPYGVTKPQWDNRPGEEIITFSAIKCKFASNNMHHYWLKIYSFSFSYNYCQTSNIRHQIPKLKCFSFRFADAFAQSIEARC